MPTSVKNLAAGVLSSGITTSSTSISVYCGSGNSTEVLGMWPTAPFYVTLSPATPAVGVSNALDSEIVLVSAVSGGNDGIVTFTVTRAQKDTTAKSFSANDIVSNAVYTDGVVVIGSDGATEMDSPWIENSDIKDGEITKAKFASGAVNASLEIPVNTAPATDSVSAWVSLLGNGDFIGQYNASSFTNQPAVYGSMETMVVGTRITQTFTDSNGTLYVRTGGSSGWYGVAGGSGAFRKLQDSEPTAYEPGDMITLNTGFTFERYSNVYKWGNLVVARFVIKSPNAITTSNTVIGSIKTAFRGSGIWSYICALGNEYTVADLGYCYVNFNSGARDVYVTTSNPSLAASNYNYIKFTMVYFI